MPANPWLPPDDLAAMSGRSDPALVVCDTRLVPTFPEISTLEPGQVRQAWPVAGPAQAHICGGSEPAYALFTSGTTGAPKLCFHSHGDPLVYNEAFARPALGLGPGHITLSVSKAYFAYGLGNSLFFPLLSGAAAVLEPELPTAEKVLTAIGRYGVRVLFGVPSFYARLVAHTQAQVLGSVSIAVCAGEVLPGLVEERMDALAGPVLLNGIGSTEVGQTFASNTVSARRRHSVGRALAPYRIRVVDDERTDLPAGAEGQLLVQGPTLARPCASATEYQPAVAGGWYATGDLAVLDQDGFLHVSGRLDDIEIVGGINVQPAEIENVMARHGRVRDVAVCASTDARGVSRLIAYVVPSPDASDLIGLETGLLEITRAALAPFKVPKGVVLVPQLPRTFTGKLRRRMLRKLATRYEETGVWQLDALSQEA